MEGEQLEGGIVWRLEMQVLGKVVINPDLGHQVMRTFLRMTPFRVKAGNGGASVVERCEDIDPIERVSDTNEDLAALAINKAALYLQDCRSELGEMAVSALRILADEP